MANHVGKVVMTLLLIAAMAISFNLYRARKQISDLLGKWGEACDTILSFAKKLEIGDEINLDGYSLPLVVNFILLQACQGKQDPRELAKAPGSLSGPAMDEGARFMRFASAAYGTALMAVFGLIPRPSAKDMADMAEKGEKQIETDAICEHTGVQPADLLVMETESLDVAGDADCLRHIVCVDRAAKAVVLALRGTASISDAVHDAVAHATPFCGGFAHAGMAAMARVVWTAAGVAVVDALRKEPSFELIVTGHSLGAGTSGLLTLMLYHLRKHPDEALPPPPPAETAVRCFAFAPPPVFMPLSKAPPGSLDAVNAFVYNCDCVPFISVRAGREMFAAMHALDDSCREHLAGADAAAGSSSHGALTKTIAKVAFGKAEVPEAMVALARERVAKLPVLEGAPELLIPSKRVTWMRPDSAGGFDGQVCDTERLAEAVLGGVPLGISMLTDHMTDNYERALNKLAPTAGTAAPKQKSA